MRLCTTEVFYKDDTQSLSNPLEMRCVIITLCTVSDCELLLLIITAQSEVRQAKRDKLDRA